MLINSEIFQQKSANTINSVIFIYIIYTNLKNMQKKIFSSNSNSMSHSRSLSSFNTMTNLFLKQIPKQNTTPSKLNNGKVLNSKTFTLTKQPSKSPTFLTCLGRLHIRSTQKNSMHILSSVNLSTSRKPSSNLFFKRKEFSSIKEIATNNEKQLRQSDSTKCHSPKGNQSSKLKITDFKKLRVIGNGKYGSVYMVKHNQTGFIAALKIIRKIDIDCLEKHEKERMIKQIIRQIKIQSYLNHPNLVKLYAHFSDEYNIYLLMELGCDGQLYDLMKQKKKFNQDSVSIVTRQILQGLSYMHKNDVIHRDIKPQNIVFIHGLAKICDFGWSVHCSKQLRSTLCGTPLYLSPQILKGDMYNQKVDIWAIGTLTYELFTSENPFMIKKKEDLSKIITDDFVMKSGPCQLKSFLNLILKKDPNSRPNSQKIKSHEFISKFRDIHTSEQICQLVYRKKQVNTYKSYYK